MKFLMIYFSIEINEKLKYKDFINHYFFSLLFIT